MNPKWRLEIIYLPRNFTLHHSIGAKNLVPSEDCSAMKLRLIFGSFQFFDFHGRKFLIDYNTMLILVVSNLNPWSSFSYKMNSHFIYLKEMCVRGETNLLSWIQSNWTAYPSMKLFIGQADSWNVICKRTSQSKSEERPNHSWWSVFSLYCLHLTHSVCYSWT